MKKFILPISLVVIVVSILVALLLVQQQMDQGKPVFGSSPEETAVLHVQQMNQAGYDIDPNTVEAIQKVVINDKVLVLVQYNARKVEPGVELCEMVLEVEKPFLKRWSTQGGVGLCHKINQSSNTVPITVVSSYGTSAHDYSTAFGYIRDEQITEVIITWEDGFAQPVSVIARTYLGAREGGFYIEKIETYNDLGEIVYTSQITPP
jgi:hypothetical protein